MVYKEHFINCKWPFDWLDFLKYNHRFAGLTNLILGNTAKVTWGLNGMLV